MHVGYIGCHAHAHAHTHSHTHTHTHTHAPQVLRMVDEDGSVKGVTVADCGCGTGKLERACAVFECLQCILLHMAHHLTC